MKTSERKLKMDQKKIEAVMEREREVELIDGKEEEVIDSRRKTGMVSP